MFTIIVFVIILSVLVFVHELGHFLTAIKFGVKCDEFGFGFPPRAIGFYKQEGKWKKVIGNKKVEDAESTIYSLNWLPLGGFVKIKGENGEGKNDPDSFAAQKAWKRGAILSAGVTMNIILAMIVISIGMMIGIPQSLDGVKDSAQVSNQQIQIMAILPGSPAEKAGLKVGDIIKSIDGQQFVNDEKLANYVHERANKPLDYVINSRGTEIEKTITPVIIPETKQGGIGVSIAEIGIVKYPWYLAIYEGIKATFWLLWMIIVGLFGILKSLFTGHGVGADVAGPIGIAVITGQVIKMGWAHVMQFAAILSLNLAIINILPLPALDGGRILFLIIEKIKGKPVKQETEALVHNLGLALLLLIVIAVTFRDVSHLGCLSCKIKALFHL